MFFLLIIYKYGIIKENLKDFPADVFIAPGQGVPAGGFPDDILLHRRQGVPACGFPDDIFIALMARRAGWRFSQRYFIAPVAACRLAVCTYGIIKTDRLPCGG